MKQYVQYMNTDNPKPNSSIIYNIIWNETDKARGKEILFRIEKTEFTTNNTIINHRNNTI